MFQHLIRENNKQNIEASYKFHRQNPKKILTLYALAYNKIWQLDINIQIIKQFINQQLNRMDSLIASFIVKQECQQGIRTMEEAC